jgi:predicted transcriptional regulator
VRQGLNYFEGANHKMATYRVHKTKDYTVMSNTHFRDRNMSLKAKGLLSLMLSLPDDWDYSINGLVAICKENKAVIRTSLDELKQLGYLVVTKLNPNETPSGRYEYLYDIYEQPQKQEVEKQGTEKQYLEIQGIENQPQLNTNKSSTNLLNTKDIKKERKNNSYDDILSAIEDESLRDLYLEYLKMRKFIKSPMTDRALKMLIDKVNRLEPYDIERQKKMLCEAIERNWKSVYPLKDEDTRNQKNGTGNIFLDMLGE